MMNTAHAQTVILATVSVFDDFSRLRYSVRHPDGRLTPSHEANPGREAWAYLTDMLPAAYVSGPWQLRISVVDRRTR